MSLRDDLLRELENDFLANAPKFTRIDEIDGKEALKPSGLAPISSWHHAVRVHAEHRPMLPQGSLSPSRSAPSFAVDNDSSECQSVNTVTKKARELKELKRKKCLENKEKYNLANVCRQNWNLSKGWLNRPETNKWDLDVVKKDIEIYAMRRNRPPKDPHKPSTRDDEDSYSKILRDIQSNSNPGPKYNLRQSAYSEEYLPTDTRRQRFDSTKKEITFGIGDRFHDISDISPGPIYYPDNNLVSTANRSAPKLYANGREYFGSIYFDVYNSCTPGPAYAVAEGSRKLSYAEQAHGTKFGAISKVDNRKNSLNFYKR